MLIYFKSFNVLASKSSCLSDKSFIGVLPSDFSFFNLFISFSEKYIKSILRISSNEVTIANAIFSNSLVSSSSFSILQHIFQIESLLSFVLKQLVYAPEDIKSKFICYITPFSYSKFTNKIIQFITLYLFFQIINYFFSIIFKPIFLNGSIFSSILISFLSPQL